MVAQLFRLGTQALYFVLVARALGPDGYGAVIAVAGLVGALAPFAAWGAGDVLVQEVVRDRTRFRAEWAAALRAVFAAGLVCGVLVLLTARVVLPAAVPLVLVALMAAAEFWGSAVISAAAQAYQAHERLGRTGQVWIVASVARAVAAAVMFQFVRTPSSVQWGALYLTATAAATVVIMRQVARELGTPDFASPAAGGNGRRRFFYSVSLSAGSIYNDIDKTMLARLSSLAAAGVYGAAYRAVEMGFAPVNALLYSSYPRFFREGARGVRANIALTRRLMPVPAVYAAAVGAVLVAAAPLLPIVLGPRYQATASVMRGLAAVPLLRTVHFFAANALTGSDHQGTRSAGQVAVAVANVGLNLWWIPRFGWRGAVWATVASEALLAAVLWVAVAGVVAYEHRRQTGASVAPPRSPGTPAGGLRDAVPEHAA